VTGVKEVFFSKDTWELIKNMLRLIILTVLLWGLLPALYVTREKGWLENRHVCWFLVIIGFVVFPWYVSGFLPPFFTHRIRALRWARRLRFEEQLALAGIIISSLWLWGICFGLFITRKYRGFKSRYSQAVWVGICYAAFFSSTMLG